MFDVRIISVTKESVIETTEEVTVLDKGSSTQELKSISFPCSENELNKLFRKDS